MSKILIITAASLQTILDKADDKTDFKKILEELISSLQVIETNEAAAAQKISALKEQLDAANIIIGEQRIALVAAEDLQAELDSALEQVGELGKMLDLQQSVRDGSVIVQVDGIAKKLLGNRFHLKGEKEMDAQAISKRPDLLQKMVAMASDALVDLDSAAGQAVNDSTMLDVE